MSVLKPEDIASYLAAMNTKDKPSQDAGLARLVDSVVNQPPEVEAVIDSTMPAASDTVNAPGSSSVDTSLAKTLRFPVDIAKAVLTSEPVQRATNFSIFDALNVSAKTVAPLVSDAIQPAPPETPNTYQYKGKSPTVGDQMIHNPEGAAAAELAKQRGRVESVPEVALPAIKITRGDMKVGDRVMDTASIANAVHGTDTVMFTAREGLLRADKLEEEGKHSQALELRRAIGKSSMDTVVATNNLSEEAALAMGYDIHEFRRAKEYNATTPAGQALQASKDHAIMQGKFNAQADEYKRNFIANNFEDYDKAIELRKQYLADGDQAGIRQTSDYLDLAESVATKETALFMGSAPVSAQLEHSAQRVQTYNQLWQSSILNPTTGDDKAKAEKTTQVEVTRRHITRGNRGIEVRGLEGRSVKELDALKRLNVSILPHAVVNGVVDIDTVLNAIQNPEQRIMAREANQYTKPTGGVPFTVDLQSNFWGVVSPDGESQGTALRGLLTLQPAIGEAYQDNPAVKDLVDTTISQVAAFNSLKGKAKSGLTAMHRDSKLMGADTLISHAVKELDEVEAAELNDRLSTIAKVSPVLSQVPEDRRAAYALTHNMNGSSETQQLALLLRKAVAGYYRKIVGFKEGQEAREYLYRVLNPMGMYTDVAIAPSGVVGG